MTSQNMPAASISTDEQKPHFFPKTGCLAGWEGHGAIWSLAITTPHPHLPELGTCKSIFTSKSCTLNKSSERSLADLEFKSLSFPWPWNVKRKTNYKSINVSGLQAVVAVTNGKSSCSSLLDLPTKALFWFLFSEDRRPRQRGFFSEA